MNGKKTLECLMVATLLVAFASPVLAEVYGAQKKGVKGRYLEVEDDVRLSSYRGALAILEPAEIVSDKNRPVDDESVRAASDQYLAEALERTGLFGEIAESLPLALADDQAVVKVTTKLTLQHGSQAMRAFVGGGAGKSKLHIRVDFFDGRTGKRLATFNGYGTGAGLWSMSGGGVQRMARDDFEENYGELVELARQAM